MKKILSVILILTAVLGLSACGAKFTDQKEALVGTKWFSGTDTSNSIVVWKFFDESVEKAEFFFDGNGIHKSEKKVATYEIQKDVLKVLFDNEEVLIPYTFENDTFVLDGGKFFTPEDIEKGIQGVWTLHKVDYIAVVSMKTVTDYNIQFENGVMINEYAADAYNGAPGEYYYYGPNEGAYTVGDGTFETDAKHGNEYFFNVHDGEIHVFHYGEEMSRGDKLPGPDGYTFD